MPPARPYISLQPMSTAGFSTLSHPPFSYTDRVPTSGHGDVVSLSTRDSMEFSCEMVARQSSFDEAVREARWRIMQHYLNNSVIAPNSVDNFRWQVFVRPSTSFEGVLVQVRLSVVSRVYNSQELLGRQMVGLLDDDGPTWTSPSERFSSPYIRSVLEEPLVGEIEPETKRPSLPPPNQNRIR